MNTKNFISFSWIASFFKWFARAFSASDEVSIKRISGYLLLTSLVSILYFTGFQWIKLNVFIAMESFLRMIFYGVLIMYGLNTGVDVAKIMKGVPTSGPDDKEKSVEQKESSIN